MKNPTRLLLVEDNAAHLADFKAMFAELSDKLPVQIEVVYVQALNQAMHLIGSVDMVLTDVFFPGQLGEKPLPYGESVVEYCLKNGKPVVWCTSTYHHGAETNAVSEWGRERGLEMFDCSVGEGQTEAPHKPWREAFYGLIALALGLEDGTYAIEDGCLMGRKPKEASEWNPTCKRYKLSGTINQVATTFLMSHDPMARRLADMGFPR